LQDILNYVIEHWDCTILIGHRTEEAQNEAYRAGRSKVQYPNSKHNSKPSRAIDVVPCNGGIDWQDLRKMTYFAGFVKGVALSKFGVTLRWGGDWDSDGQVLDNSFNDLPHFELVD
jgi:hypothetical protein